MLRAVTAPASTTPQLLCVGRTRGRALVVSHAEWTRRTATHHPCPQHAVTLHECRARQRSPVACKAATYNPQNVPDPEVRPTLAFSARQAVEEQLKALQKNDTPWMNHGIQVMYEFSADAGGMERSRYFGFSKDLYHFDHFLGAFNTTFAGAIDSPGFTVLSEQEDARGTVVRASVNSSRVGRDTLLQFVMVRGEFGRKQGCWLTKQLTVVKEGR